MTGSWVLAVCLLGGIASWDQGKVQVKNRVDCNKCDNILYNREEHTFSDEEQDKITFVGDCIYKYKVLCINYTTYNLWRAQDSINICTQPYVMTLGHEDEEAETTWHLYWYARVLAIFHVNVRISDRTETECMEFLWVHWFRCDPDHEGSFETCRLHCIGLTDSDDPTSYGFLNPSDAL